MAHPEDCGNDCQPRDEVTSAGLVECAQCGHVLEDGHGLTGCTAVQGCGCRVRWTVRQIEAVRRRNGLPGRWRR